jgi:GT2 family glycosyltransferase
MGVSIVTALYNRLDLTREFLVSLERHPPPEPWEIIWVDDGSTDGTREWLRTLPGPRHHVVLNEVNLGYAAANNRGAALATGRTLALLNNDLVLTPGWFTPMADILSRFPGAGLVGNVQLNAKTGAVDHSGFYYYARGKPAHDRTLPPAVPSPARPVPAATGACLLVAHERFRALGGFDPVFRNGCEDVDLCLRARAAGWQNYVALNSVIRHHVSSSPGRSDHNQRNAYLLMRRWQDTIPALAAASWQELALRDRWESKLTGWPWLRARLSRSILRNPQQDCPRWMRQAVTRLVERDLARWRRMFPEI